MSNIQGFTYEYTSETELARLLVDRLASVGEARVGSAGDQAVIAIVNKQTGQPVIFKNIEAVSDFFLKSGVYAKTVKPYRESAPATGRIDWQAWGRLGYN